MGLREELDQQRVARSLRLARRGEGRVEPNPMVGCVVARGAKILGDGFHRRFGGPHAEVAALRSCRESPRGATAYVTLEPCCHFGKTPPCTDALIQAGIKRVVIPLLDPDSRVNGRGVRALRDAGVEVDVGEMAKEAAELLAPFATRIRLERPYTIAKWAQTLDGSLIARTDGPRWISGEASRELVHRLRAQVDAVVVGSGTVLVDDPRLTARGVPLRRVAARVVLDGRLRITPECALAKTAKVIPTLVMTSANRAKNRKADRLRRLGVEIVPVASRGGRLSIRECLRILARRECTNVLLEGGATLLQSFFRAGLVDETWVFVAPVWSGLSSSKGRVSSDFFRRGTPESSAHVLSIKSVGRDAWFRFRFQDPMRLFAAGTKDR